MQILTPRQIAFLEFLGEEEFVRNNFYLTGGTALAAFYTHHRYSEDLDFFSEDEIDVSSLNILVKKLQTVFSATKTDYQGSFNRNIYFLTFDDEVLKKEAILQG